MSTTVYGIGEVLKFTDQACSWSEYTEDVDWSFCNAPGESEECYKCCANTEGCTGFEVADGDSGYYCAVWMNDACLFPDLALEESLGTDTYTMFGLDHAFTKYTDTQCVINDEGWWYYNKTVEDCLGQCLSSYTDGCVGFEITEDDMCYIFQDSSCSITNNTGSDVYLMRGELWYDNTNDVWSWLHVTDFGSFTLIVVLPSLIVLCLVSCMCRLCCRLCRRKTTERTSVAPVTIVVDAERVNSDEVDVEDAVPVDNAPEDKIKEESNDYDNTYDNTYDDSHEDVYIDYAVTAVPVTHDDADIVDATVVDWTEPVTATVVSDDDTMSFSEHSSQEYSDETDDTEDSRDSDDSEGTKDYESGDESDDYDRGDYYSTPDPDFPGKLKLVYSDAMRETYIF
jgi:hypothetical protein